jgi:Tfp pilus assembly protein PilE
MKACAIFKNKKGSSSIMVMLIMIVLVVFGVLALMSSYSDFKLAKKSAAWHAKYYDLDAKGEEFVSKVNAKLTEAAKAVNANDDSGFAKLVKINLNQLAKDYKIKMVDSKEGLVVNAVIEDADQNKLGISLIVGMLSKRNINNNDINSNNNSTINKGSNSTTLSSDKYKYYKVAEWKQLPKEFKYDGQNDLWNGEVTNP